MTVWYYVLEGDGTVRPAGSLDEWAGNQEARHFVATDEIDRLRVVTIFDGITIVPGDVFFFGTAVIDTHEFRSTRSGVLHEERRDTYAEAMAEHARTVAEIRVGTWKRRGGS